MPSRTNIALPVITADREKRRSGRMGRRRTIALIVVHLLVLAHIWHYLATGATFTPLEPSEASYSIESSAINAGAIFLVVLILSTLLFGRFFCGWACHVVAYQDLSRWILGKLGIRPRPVRARLLMLVPLFAVYWLYGRPLIGRWTHGHESELSLHLTTDDFWATFPGGVIAILTFLVCGFVIVYFLGSKGFCTYGCPYGMLFGISDRVSPGRIRVNESCEHSGQCTKNCSSNVNVAREVALYGAVVDPNCLKCMDCIAGCPNDALYFGFKPASSEIAQRGKSIGLSPAERKQTIGGKPAKAHPAWRFVSRFFRRGRHPARHWDLTWCEELFAAACFAGVFWVFYLLYGVVPFLMTLGVCVIVVYLLLIAGRLLYRPRVEMQGRVLKSQGRLTAGGGFFAMSSLLLLLFVGHSGIVKWHTRAAVKEFEVAQDTRFGDASIHADAAASCRRHLALLDSWGLWFTLGAGRMQGELARWSGDPEAAVEQYTRELEAMGRKRSVRMYRMLAFLSLGRVQDAGDDLSRTFGSRETPRGMFLQFDGEMRWMMREGTIPPYARRAALELHLDVLRRGITVHPDDGEMAVAACTVLVRGLGDSAEALRLAESVCEANGRSDANLLSLLAYLYSEAGRHEEALAAGEDSLRLAREKGQEKIAREMVPMVAQYRAAVRSR